MNNYYIGTTIIQQETNYPNTPLIQKIVIPYSDFDKYFCDPVQPNAQEVCNNRARFETAGILFLIFSCLAHAFLVYGVLGLLGMACGCSCCGFLKKTAVNYIYPGVYALALLLYVTVSEVFSLSNPTENSNNDMKVQAGIILMFAAQAVAIASLIFYIFTKNQLVSLTRVTHDDYVPVKS